MVSLKTFFLEMFASRDKAVDHAFLAMEHRLENMNEFREALSDQTARFITRDEHNVLMDVVNHTSQQVQINTRGAATKEELNKHIQDSMGQFDALGIRLGALETKFWVGGSGLVLLLGLIQVLVNLFLGHVHSP